MSILAETSKPKELKTFIEIVNFAQAIQSEYEVINHLKTECHRLREQLLNICRQCKDENCMNNNYCEVKQAYDLVIRSIAAHD